MYYICNRKGFALLFDAIYRAGKSVTSVCNAPMEICSEGMDRACHEKRVLFGEEKK